MRGRGPPAADPEGRVVSNFGTRNAGNVSRTGHQRCLGPSVGFGRVGTGQRLGVVRLRHAGIRGKERETQGMIRGEAEESVSGSDGEE